MPQYEIVTESNIAIGTFETASAAGKKAVDLGLGDERDYSDPHADSGWFIRVAVDAVTPH